LDTSEFVVLHPKVALEYFSGGGEMQHRCITFGQWLVVVISVVISQSALSARK
jgi:hypothetical protein